MRNGINTNTNANNVTNSNNANNANNTNKEFDLELKIKNKVINYRKWKLKDRLNFIKEYNNEVGNYAENLIRNAMQQKDVALNEDEYKYILMNIFGETFGYDLEYDVICGNCEHKFSYNIKLNEVFKESYNKDNIIKTERNEIVLGEIKNDNMFIEYYQNAQTNVERDIIELAFSIESVNGSVSLTLDSIIESLYEMDSGEFEEIMVQFDDFRFKLESEFNCRCPECSSENNFTDLEFPNLLPFYWLEENK